MSLRTPGRGFLFLVLLLAACGMIRRPVPPRVTLADIRLVDLTLLEQRYRLTLRVQNPNAFDLSIQGLDYELDVNGQDFGSGVSNRPVTVPAYGTQLLEVDAYSTLAGLLRQFRELSPDKPLHIRYRIKGRLRVGGSGVTLPFEHSGEISLESRDPGKGATL